MELSRMSSKHDKNEMKNDVVEKTIYILVEDRVGELIPKNLVEKWVLKGTRKLTRSDREFQPQMMLKGALFYEQIQEKQPEDSSLVALVSIDNPQIVLETSLKDIREISKEHAEMLQAIPSNNDRYDILNDRERLRKASNSKKGDKVSIDMDGSDPKGTLMYKGILHKEKGIYFGVKLSKPVGDGDGSYGGITHFKCEKNCGIFVPLHKINFEETLSKETSTEKSGSKVSKVKSKYCGDVERVGDLTVGTRIVYFPEKMTRKNKDKVSRGVIRFLGHHDKYDKTVLAGVEMDERIGKKLGHFYHGKKVFECPEYKGLVVLPDELLREDEFDQKSPNGKESYEFLTTIEGTEATKESKLKKEEIKPIKIEPIDPIKEQMDLFKRHEERKQEKKDSLTINNTQVMREPSENELVGNIHYHDSIHYHDNMINKLNNEIQGSNCLQNPSGQFKEAGNRNQPTQVRLPIKSNINDDSAINRVHEREHGKSIPKYQSLCAYTTNNMTTENPTSVKVRKESNSEIPTSGTEKISEYFNMTEYNQKHVPKFEENYFKQERHEPEQLSQRPVPSRTATPNKDDPSLQLGSVVEIRIRQTPYYGVIRWKGIIEEVFANEVLAGLELEDTIQSGSDGTIKGKRYFTSAPGRGFFVKLAHCKPDARFCSSLSPQTVNVKNRYKDEPIVIKGSVLPTTKLEDKFVGRYKGIQGHHNSCYMDATLFAMFGFSYVFDAALHRQKRSYDIDEYEEVQTILREKIVNPLRKTGYVQHPSVMELRRYLNDLGNIGGFLNEEKDPEEFVVLLFEKVLKIDPFVKLRANNHEESSHLYQIFTEADQRNPLPSVQSLLEHSFLNTNLKLVETPPVMILQMPRFGLQKLYSRIRINPVLDITSILSNVLHPCVICGDSTTELCTDCACAFGLETVNTYLCASCWPLIHKHPKRQHHKPPIVSANPYPHSYVQERVTMELFAVVCINTSHYVSFVKCGSGEDETWVFFDSMADRKGEESGHNIPEVSRLNDVNRYLNAQPLEIANFNKKTTDERILRLYEDASLCFYRNKEVNMYK